MKLIRTLFFIFLIVLIVGAIGVAMVLVKGANIDSVKNFITSVSPATSVFRDTEFGISFRYPREWKEHYASPKITLFSKEDGATMTLVLMTRKDAETLQQFTGKNIKEIQESATSVGKKIDMETVEQATFGGLSANRFVYHTEQNGIAIDGVQLWAVKDKKEYSVTFAARSDLFKTAVQTFDSVLQSVQIK